jgi:hypothetical protein
LEFPEVDGHEKDVAAKKIKSSLSLTFHLTKIKHQNSGLKMMMWWGSYLNLTWIVKLDFVYLVDQRDPAAESVSSTCLTTPFACSHHWK